VPIDASSISLPMAGTVGNYTISLGTIISEDSYALREAPMAGYPERQCHRQALAGKGSGSYAYRSKACNVAGCGPYSNTHHGVGYLATSDTRVQFT
jgi:hypothetical protein